MTRMAWVSGVRDEAGNDVALEGAEPIVYAATPIESLPLYVWSEPRGLSAEAAATLIDDWRSGGGDPAWSPFKPSADVARFYHELSRALPDVEAISDAERTTPAPSSPRGADTPRPARIVIVRVTVDRVDEELAKVYGLAAKYHLVVFDPRSPTADRMYAALTAVPGVAFWPFGASRAIAGSAIAGVIAYGASMASIPVVSGVVAAVGVCFVLLGVATVVGETWSWWRRRRGNRP